MRSRYSAFASSNPNYIIKTTHPENPEFTEDKKEWENSILGFCKSSTFNNLEIIEFIDGNHEAYVTFQATIFCKGEDISFCEKSKFVKSNTIWLYHSGEFL